MKQLIPTAFLFILILASCHKDPGTAIDYGQGTGRCRLTRVDVHENYSPIGKPVILTYDDHNRLSSVYNTGISTSAVVGTVDFKYYGDIIVADRPSQLSPDTIILNKNHQILRIISNNYSIRNVSDYNYDGSGQLTSVENFPNTLGFTGSTQYFKWANGDVVYDSTGPNFHFIMDYYNRPAQYASPMNLVYFTFYGVPAYRSRHLEYTRIQIPGSSNQDSITYAFDGEGKVIADTVHSSNVNSRYYNTFTYECH